MNKFIHQQNVVHQEGDGPTASHELGNLGTATAQDQIDFPRSFHGNLDSVIVPIPCGDNTHSLQLCLCTCAKHDVGKARLNAPPGAFQL